MRASSRASSGEEEEEEEESEVEYAEDDPADDERGVGIIEELTRRVRNAKKESRCSTMYLLGERASTLTSKYLL